MATLFVEYVLLNLMSINIYLVLVLVALMGGVLWWKKAKMLAYGVFVALLISTCILFFAIWSFI
jgi:hypothetical protein